MLLGCGVMEGGVDRGYGCWETDPMMSSTTWDAPGASQYEVLGWGASRITVYRYLD